MKCIELYILDDGTFRVTKSMKEELAENEAMEDEDEGQPAATLNEAVGIIKQLATEPAPEEEEATMDQAMAGYKRTAARQPMQAPNPNGVFGE